MKDGAVWCNNFTRAGATAKSAVFMFGMQKLEVTGRAFCEEQGEVLVSNSGWQPGMENVKN